MLTIADLDDTLVLGDLALRLSCEGRSAEIGYSLATEHWNHGYATEAVEGLAAWLLEVQGVSRVQATVDPDNLASALVLERAGFIFESTSRLASWVGDTNSDDQVYALVRTDWEAWRSRPSSPPETVTLVELTEANFTKSRHLATHKSQERFVSPMYGSFANALFPEVIDGAPVVPWLRGVVADDEWVGFVMLALVTDSHPEPYLWRLLVDRLHQRRGIGRRILDLVVEEVRSSGADTLLTSWTEGRGSPRPFYERYGFVPTGQIIDDETEARFPLG